MSLVALGFGGRVWAGLEHVWQAWRSPTPKALLSYLVLGLVYSLIELSNLVHLTDAPAATLTGYVARHVAEPLLVLACWLMVWLPVARSDPWHPHRLWRLLAATLIAGLLAWAAIRMLLVQGLDLPSFGQVVWALKGKPYVPVDHWTRDLAQGLTALIPCALLSAVDEMQQRRALTQQRLEHSVMQQSLMARQALSTRLAALQAQVEPELLFDTLVEIEAAYAKADPQAAAQMERLIRHLRVALPRLRDGGSRLDQEVELLDSYLALLAGRHGQTMSLRFNGADTLRQRTLPPMLLLPLLQRALKLAIVTQQRLPQHCQLDAQTWGPQAQGLRLDLSLDLPGLCGDDETLRTLTQRLHDSSGGPARLYCHSDALRTVFTLELDT